MTDDIYAKIRSDVVDIARSRFPSLPAAIIRKVEVSLPRDPKHGDASSNVALILAGTVHEPAPVLSAAIAADLIIRPNYLAATSAGPGFINIRLDPGFICEQLRNVLRAGTAFGDSTVGNGARVNVEYVSANPTGPMHIGHCRGAVVGDALANLLAKAGYDVTKEFYINDAGAQVTALAWAAYWRYLQAIGTPISEADFSDEVPGGLQYRGEYLIPIGQRLAELYGTSLALPD